MSPSKKTREVRSAAARQPADFEERGLLFGNATNAKARCGAPKGDDFDMGANIGKTKATSRKGTKAKVPKSQVEVVLESRLKSRRGVASS